MVYENHFFKKYHRINDGKKVSLPDLYSLKQEEIKSLVMDHMENFHCSFLIIINAESFTARTKREKQ